MAIAYDEMMGETMAERVVPWVSSFLVHAGFGLVMAFVVFVVIGRVAVKEPAYEPIAIPGGDVNLPQFKGVEGDRDTSVESPMKAMQNKFKDPANGVDALGDLTHLQKTAQGMLDRTGERADLIALGDKAGLGLGNNIRPGGDGPGLRAPYGPQLVSGVVGTFIPKTRAKRTVYLLDHSGSMLPSFDYLRNEVIDATDHLNAGQQFAVIMFSEDVSVLGPDHLRWATRHEIADVVTRLGRVRAQGQNDDLLEPFQKGFERAFAMKPELIIFLTDGNFDSRLVDVVKKLNKDKVQIQTIAFIEISPTSEESLKQIAKDGGGKYKFVSAKDLPQ